MKLFKILKNKLCMHVNKELISWRFCDYPKSDINLKMRCQYKCKKCGKVFYKYLEKDTGFERANIGKYWAKELSTDRK